jgi:integrase
MMQPKRDLTDRALKALKPAPRGKRPILWDAQVAGFGVRYNDRAPRPDRTFVLVARYPGFRHPAPRAIGEYPTMELARARQTAREWRELVAGGVDPKDKADGARRAAEAAKKETERRQANTFAAAFGSFAQEHLSTLRTGAVVAGVIEKHVMSVFGARPLAEITRADGNELLRSIARETPTHANRIGSYLSKFGQWAEDDGRIGESPFVRLRRFAKETARDRVLSDLEIRAVWRACAGMGAFGRAVRFMLATGQRRSEVGGMEWKEFDEAKKLWTLPRERVKADRAHEVPLSPLALCILAESARMGAHVFTTRGPPISGWSKFKERLDGLALAEMKRLAGDDAELPEWHLHDLRRTCATHLARLRVERTVISKVLNHAEGGVTRIYDQYAYLDEKRAALERWGARLAAIVEGREPDAENVVHLAARG